MLPPLADAPTKKKGERPMTAGQTTRRLSSPSLAPVPLAALLVAALLGGAILGAAITMKVGSNGVAAPAIGIVQPAAPFDAVQFRLEEHAGLAPQATFDIVRFRAGERAPLGGSTGSGSVKSEPRHLLGGP
jgi:hypothetical protein